MLQPVLTSICLAAQVYALAFWYGGRLVAWHEANFGDTLKVLKLLHPAAPPHRYSNSSGCSSASGHLLWCLSPTGLLSSCHGRLRCAHT